MPRKPTRFTLEAREALLEAIKTHRWATAREAHEWVGNILGIKVAYQTVWLFLSDRGYLIGDRSRGRRFCADSTPPGALTGQSVTA
jgi:hypothetical protein